MLRSSLVAALVLFTGACFYDLAPKTGAATQEASGETTGAATTGITTTTGAAPTTGAASSDTGATTTSGSTSGDATTGSSSTTEPAPGTTLEPTTGVDDGLYGPCAPILLPCPDAQLCQTVPGLRGSFCSPACVGTECPAAPPGVSAQPLCALADAASMEPTHCALICDPQAKAACPAGMSCKAVEDQPLGVCTAP